MAKIEMEDCMVCGGAGTIHDQGGWCVYAECLDCGSHTAFLEYKTPEEREEMEEKTIHLWNAGKVVRESRAE